MLTLTLTLKDLDEMCRKHYDVLCQILQYGLIESCVIYDAPPQDQVALQLAMVPGGSTPSSTSVVSKLSPLKMNRSDSGLGTEIPMRSFGCMVSYGADSRNSVSKYLEVPSIVRRPSGLSASPEGYGGESKLMSASASVDMSKKEGHLFTDLSSVRTDTSKKGSSGDIDISIERLTSSLREEESHDAPAINMRSSMSPNPAVGVEMLDFVRRHSNLAPDFRAAENEDWDDSRVAGDYV